jgi:hypothetical protein
MRRFALLAGFAATLAALPAAAQACTPNPNYRPPTQAEQDRATRERFRAAAAVVEVVAERGSTLQRPGRMRVVRAYKGNVRIGTRLSVTSVPGSMCGYGDFATGSRGIIIIDRAGAPLFFAGYVSDAQAAMLRRAGLLPPR